MSLREREGESAHCLQSVIEARKARPCTTPSTVRPIAPAGASIKSGKTRTTSTRLPPLSLRFFSCSQPHFERRPEAAISTPLQLHRVLRRRVPSPGLRFLRQIENQPLQDQTLIRRLRAQLKI